MNAIDLYHHLPYSLKTVAATIQGYFFSSWRYGAGTEDLVAEALERESWTPTKWKSWQEEQLAFILHRAATKVPYYRNLWNDRRKNGDNSSWDMIENWPILEKEPLRIDSSRFLAEDCNPRKMRHLVTSGTTGTSVTLWWSREMTFRWYALFEARWRRWYHLHYRDRWAYFGGKMVAPVWQKKPPFWVWNGGMNQLYLSSYHLRPGNTVHYLDALTKYKIKYILGYASSIYAIAHDVLQYGLKAPEMKIAITCAEPLYQYQREVISTAFRCPVRETYGMAEAATGASECDHGSMHCWPELGYLEAVEGVSPVGPGVSGDLLVTGLYNPDMPLIRFRIGDRAKLPEFRSCACGRSLPVFPEIEGRCDDVVILPDGRRIGRFSTIFKGDIPFREFQVIQEELESIRVLCVATSEYSAGAEKIVEKKLRERLGNDIRIYFEIVKEIPRTKNGKFRAVISLLPKEVSTTTL